MASFKNNKTLNTRHARVGPRILTALHHKEKYKEMEELFLGPIFSSAVTIKSLVAALSLDSCAGTGLLWLDLDLSRIHHNRTGHNGISSCSGGGNDSRAEQYCWDDEMRLLVQGLPRTVQHLTLRFPNAKDAAIKAFAAALLEQQQQQQHQHDDWKGLVTLDLKSNRIGDNGAVALANSLRQIPHETSLQTLILSSNNIGRVGAIALAQALQCTRLRRLDLSYNTNIDTEAVLTLCNDALINNIHLQELNLCQCSGILTESGVKALWMLLEKHNDILQRIHLKPKRPVRHDREPAFTSAALGTTATASTSDAHNNDEDDEKKRKEAFENAFVQVEHWLLLNRSGRRLLSTSSNTHQKERDRTQVPVGLWPNILAKSTTACTKSCPPKVLNPDVAFFLLQQNPNLVSYVGRPRKTKCCNE